MATTTTYYAYDRSGRMTTQWSFDTADATYFTYDQRDMVLQFYHAPGGDANRYFTYNGVGERAIVIDGGGPTYWTYDRRKLLTEKATTGSATRRYRHNESNQVKLGSNVEVGSASFGNTHPVTDQGGSLSQVQTIEGNDVLEMNACGELLASTNNVGDRLQVAQTLGLQALTTSQRFLVLPNGGIYHPRTGAAFGGVCNQRSVVFRSRDAGLPGVADRILRGLFVLVLIKWLLDQDGPPVLLAGDPPEKLCTPTGIEFAYDTTKTDPDKGTKEGQGMTVTVGGKEIYVGLDSNAPSPVSLLNLSTTFVVQVKLKLTGGAKCTDCHYYQYVKAVITWEGKRTRVGEVPNRQEGDPTKKLDLDGFYKDGIHDSTASPDGSGVTDAEGSKEGFELDVDWSKPPAKYKDLFWCDGDSAFWRDTPTLTDLGINPGAGTYDFKAIAVSSDGKTKIHRYFHLTQKRRISGTEIQDFARFQPDVQLLGGK